MLLRNYNMEATEDDGTCEYPQDYYSCDGVCLIDTDEDGVCDELEIAGCTDSTAINYSSDATNDDGSCDYSFSECVLPPEWEGNTGSNMTVMLLPNFISSLGELTEGAYVVAQGASGMFVVRQMYMVYHKTLSRYGVMILKHQSLMEQLLAKLLVYNW